MSLVLNTNISSLTVQRNLSKSQSSLSMAMERLSSGLRINHASDDAAGMAISSRMSTQINGLGQAQRNANDGISLSQTAEGALTELTSNLQRIRELAVQAANSSNSDSDRATLDAEVQQRLAEVNRIATTTSFNGRKVLDGSFGSAAFQVGANAGETIGISLQTSMKTSAIGGLASAATTDLSSLFSSDGLTLATGGLTVSVGGAAAVSVAAGSYTTTASLVTAINTAAGSTIAAASGNEIVFTNTDTANAIDFGGAAATTLGIADVAAATAGAGATTGTASTLDITLTATDFSTTNANFSVNGTAVLLDQAYADEDAVAAAIQTQLGGTYTAVNNAGTITITNTDTVAAHTVTIAGANAGATGAGINNAAGTVGTADTAAGSTTNATGTSTAVYSAVSATAAATTLTLASGDFTITGSDGVSHDLAGTYASSQDLADAINSAVTGMTALVNSTTGLMTLNSATAFTVGGTTASTAVSAGGLGLTAGAHAASGNLTSVDVLNADDANDTIMRMDSALTAVSDLQSQLGAIQNRFQSAINSTSTTAENLTAARSRIQDTDFASETSKMTSANILQQAGVSVLAQANSSQQSILKLLQ